MMLLLKSPQYIILGMKLFLISSWRISGIPPYIKNLISGLIPSKTRMIYNIFYIKGLLGTVLRIFNVMAFP